MVRVGLNTAIGCWAHRLQNKEQILMDKLIKVLVMVGYSWVTIVGVYILLQYIRVLVTDGLPFEQRLLSFLNLWNIIFAFISLMPGLGCILISDYLQKKHRGKN